MRGFRGRLAAAGALLALSACTGGGSTTATSGSAGATAAAPATSTTTAAATTGPCTLRARQDWALAQLRDWYLFPETLPTNVDPAAFTTVQAYIDALTATARAQGRDRNFTFITSIAGENAFFNSGSSAGFGVRLAFDAQQRLFIAEAFEGAPALAAGIDRGAEIIAIGTTTANLATVASLLASGGSGAVNEALGPSTAGTTRVLRIADAAGTRNISVTKADFALAPVSSRYGARIITDGGQRVGYINLRTFISTADPALRSAFADFRAQGITRVIFDLRYDGGGLVSTAELIGDLLGGARTTSQVFSFTTFRPERSSNNSTRNFSPQPQSISPMQIAFIGTSGTASASELVINAMIPYLRANAALIGSNTDGKPVGQIALDMAACDDRLRVVAFATLNADRRGDYFNGLASVVEASCRAPDDLTRPLGDPAEGSVRAALDFLAGRACAPITATATAGTGPAPQSTPVRLDAPNELLIADDPDAMQRQVPGAF